jgi:hypothetical protein
VTARAIHDVRKLVHQAPLGKGAVEARSQHGATWDVMLPVDGPGIIAVDVRAVTSERYKVCGSQLSVGAILRAVGVEPLPLVPAQAGTWIHSNTVGS